MIRFRGHQFAKDVILLAESRIMVDAASIHRWVCKFGVEIRKRALSCHGPWRGLTWYVDET